MSRKEPEQLDFENSLEELNTIVLKMETGNLTLEDSLAQFERGIALTRKCQNALRNAEQKIKILTTEEDKNQLEHYENE